MFIPPMLLERRDDPFNDPDYIFEPKIDGHRLVLSFQNGKARLFTRHNNECTRQYPELLDVPVNGDVVLDGEVCCLDSGGNIDFEMVMERFRMTKGPRIRASAASQPVNYIVFDILSYKGEDLRHLPLMERKAILDRVLTENAYYTKIKHVAEQGEALFQVIGQRNMEGIVAKHKDSSYVSRRSDRWLKVINYEYADVYITGYRKNEFGWLASVNDGNGLMRTVGIIELAVPPAHKKAFHGVSKSIITGEDRNFVYVQPRIKAKVKFRNWTKAGLLRTPAFVDFVI